MNRENTPPQNPCQVYGLSQSVNDAVDRMKSDLDARYLQAVVTGLRGYAVYLHSPVAEAEGIR